jgi:DNA-binding protein Fis
MAYECVLLALARNTLRQKLMAYECVLLALARNTLRQKGLSKTHITN